MALARTDSIEKQLEAARELITQQGGVVNAENLNRAMMGQAVDSRATDPDTSVARTIARGDAPTPRRSPANAAEEPERPGPNLTASAVARVPAGGNHEGGVQVSGTPVGASRHEESPLPPPAASGSRPLNIDPDVYRRDQPFGAASGSDGFYKALATALGLGVGVLGGGRLAGRMGGGPAAAPLAGRAGLAGNPAVPPAAAFNRGPGGRFNNPNAPPPTPVERPPSTITYPPGGGPGPATAAPAPSAAPPTGPVPLPGGRAATPPTEIPPTVVTPAGVVPPAAAGGPSAVEQAVARRNLADAARIRGRMPMGQPGGRQPLGPPAPPMPVNRGVRQWSGGERME